MSKPQSDNHSPVPILSRHYLGTVYTSHPTKLIDASSCLEALRTILAAHDATYLGDTIHTFPNDSFTAVVALSESHISVHTWPERGAVQLDVFLCNYLRDNTKKSKNIYNEIVNYFEGHEHISRTVKRP